MIIYLLMILNFKGDNKMRTKTAKNNDFLYKNREGATPKVYALLVELVNEDREDLAKIVVKIDYLVEYAINAMRQKDFKEAKEALDGVEPRMEILKKENVDTSYLDYIYEGAIKRCKVSEKK